MTDETRWLLLDIQEALLRQGKSAIFPNRDGVYYSPEDSHHGKKTFSARQKKEMLPFLLKEGFIDKIFHPSSRSYNFFYDMDSLSLLGLKHPPEFNFNEGRFYEALDKITTFNLRLTRKFSDALSEIKHENQVMHDGRKRHSTQENAGGNKKTLKLPEGTQWKSVTCKFVTDMKLEISVHDMPKNTYVDLWEIGFATHKFPKYTIYGELLMFLAKNNGELDKDSLYNALKQHGSSYKQLSKKAIQGKYQPKKNNPEQQAGTEQQTKKLSSLKYYFSQKMKKVFSIDDDPFKTRWLHNNKGIFYKLKMTVLPD